MNVVVQLTLPAVRQLIQRLLVVNDKGKLQSIWGYPSTPADVDFFFLSFPFLVNNALHDRTLELPAPEKGCLQPLPACMCIASLQPTHAQMVPDIPCASYQVLCNQFCVLVALQYKACCNEHSLPYTHTGTRHTKYLIDFIFTFNYQALLSISQCHPPTLLSHPPAPSSLHISAPCLHSFQRHISPDPAAMSCTLCFISVFVTRSWARQCVKRCTTDVGPWTMLYFACSTNAL